MKLKNRLVKINDHFPMDYIKPSPLLVKYMEGNVKVSEKEEVERLFKEYLEMVGLYLKIKNRSEESLRDVFNALPAILRGQIIAKLKTRISMNNQE